VGLVCLANANVDHDGPLAARHASQHTQPGRIAIGAPRMPARAVAWRPWIARLGLVSEVPRCWVERLRTYWVLSRLVARRHTAPWPVTQYTYLRIHPPSAYPPLSSLGLAGGPGWSPADSHPFPRALIDADRLGAPEPQSARHAALLVRCTTPAVSASLLPPWPSESAKPSPSSTSRARW